MMTTRIKKCVALALAMGGACIAYPQSAVRDLANAADAYMDNSREKREQEAAPARIKEIFALAKKSAEDDFNVNFCGFFVGMSNHDAIALAEYYRLKVGEYSMDAEPGRAVYRIRFSLKGVRRVTKGGNTLEELAQAVANRVGDLKHYKLKDLYELKTIDGVVLSLNDGGLVIQNDGVASQKPLATTEAVQEYKANEEAVQRAAQEALPRLIRDMVVIPGRDFKMGKYEVTQKQWYAIMGYNSSMFKGDDNPVEKVSWDDCHAFLEKLNALPAVRESGLAFRLPTEKEWQYACRAGATGNYCKLADGTEITESTLGEVAWYEDNSERTTHPVGLKKPNAFGLYDMHGNVEEWCEDLYNAGGGPLRVGQGGCFGFDSRDCTVRRRPFHHSCRFPFIGFRLAASQE